MTIYVPYNFSSVKAGQILTSDNGFVKILPTNLSTDLVFMFLRKLPSIYQSFVNAQFVKLLHSQSFALHRTFWRIVFWIYSIIWSLELSLVFIQNHKLVYSIKCACNMINTEASHVKLKISVRQGFSLDLVIFVDFIICTNILPLQKQEILHGRNLSYNL